MNIKHTILMVTYNQEDYIRVGLDSILNQDVLPFEIIIGDDCSTDNTRKIILEYKEKFPNIIKPVFHEKNLGINQNLNYIIENVKIEGDMVHYLDGDDFFKDDMLKTFNDYILKNNLNPQKEKFLLMSNQLHLLPNGEEKEAINNYQLQGKNYLKLKLRSKIGNRYTGISRALFNEMGVYNLNLGLWADHLHSFDTYIHCDNFYFINKSFPVYRQGSGVTSKEKKEVFAKSWIQVANFILNNRKEYLDKQDKIYLQKTICKAKIVLDRSLKNKVSFMKYYILSFGDVLDGYTDIKSYIYEISILYYSLPPLLRQ